MKTNMLIFILIIIVTCFSCSSNKKIVVEQIDSNYPIILVKGKNVNNFSSIKFPLVFNISTSFFDKSAKLGSIGYLHNSLLLKKATWMAGAILYNPKSDDLQPVKRLQKISFIKNEFVVYTRHSVSYHKNDELERFFQSYCDYMNENHKDTLHIESIQQLKNKNPDLVNAFLEGDSLLFRVYYNHNLVPYTYPVRVK